MSSSSSSSCSSLKLAALALTAGVAGSLLVPAISWAHSRLRKTLLRKRASFLHGQNIISASQFSREQVEVIFSLAEEMKQIVETQGGCDLLKGKVLASFFLEPSTRTCFSFQTAMMRLGGSVVNILPENSSLQKKETVYDSIKALQSYCDVIAIRSKNRQDVDEAASAANVPILNGGNGIGEHPTQALLDMFTIMEKLGRIDSLHITLLGDLKNGRTVHSLAKLLSLFNIHLHYCSPEGSEMPDEVIEQVERNLASRNLHERQHKHTSLEEVLPITDVLYVTRVQTERMTAAEAQRLEGAYRISNETLKLCKERMCIMHPLPRVWEILPEVDNDPRACYFDQMSNGLYVRMALLAGVLGQV